MSRGRPRKYPIESLDKIVEILKSTEYYRGIIPKLAQEYNVPAISVYTYLKKNNLVFK